MDVKATFLNGTIDEEGYIEKLEGFEMNGRDTNVCSLNKALYVLKKNGMQMDAYLLRIRLIKKISNPNIYIKVVNNEPAIILL